MFSVGSDIAGGAYVLKVTATDTNGLSATEISKPFFIRNLLLL